MAVPGQPDRSAAGPGCDSAGPKVAGVQHSNHQTKNDQCPDTYRLVVRSIVRKTFRQLSAGDYHGLVEAFAPEGVFCFMGQHALGGARSGPVVVGQWFDPVS